MNHIEKSLPFEQVHVLVIGDIMLDKYSWGNVDRISPEAPVPIVSIYKTEHRCGGAANVALNCKALGAKVAVASVAGKDEAGQQLIEQLNAASIDSSLVLLSASRITTTKTRVLSKSQQMLRLDSELATPLDTKDEHAFIDAILRYLQIQKPQLVIFQDYNKGVLKKNVIQKVLQHCQHLNITTAVDPKSDHFFEYKGVDIFKPNLKEVREAFKLEQLEVTTNNLAEIHQQLYNRLQHKISFITLSEHGVYYQQQDGAAKLIPTHKRNIADVSGAGDTVIAVAALVYALTQNAETMAVWSNIAGGLVCEEIGVVPIKKDKLLEEVNQII